VTGRACDARSWSRGPPSMPESQSTRSDRRIMSSRPVSDTPKPDTSATYFGCSAARVTQKSFEKDLYSQNKYFILIFITVKRQYLQK